MSEVIIGRPNIEKMLKDLRAEVDGLIPLVLEKNTEITALRQQMAELSKLAYAYPPSEPFAPDGETWKQRAESAEAKLKKCREALEFYARILGNSKSMDIRIIHQDGGNRAQQTLKEIGEK